MGRVLLAHDPACDALLASVVLTRHTDKTVKSKAKLREILADVRARGHCLVDQELEAGLRSIAVPIFDRRGRLLAAMNVSGQANRVTLDEMRRAFLPILQRAAEDLQKALP
jgi:IclR family pca regulon transcriptional regulator